MGDSKSKLYVSIEEAGKAIFNFIGSDEYESILASIEGGERGGFMTGLAISICVLMTNANKVVGMPAEEHFKETDNTNQIPDDDYFNIFFNDLNEDAQNRLLKYVGANDPKEENWDIDMCPIAMFYREPSLREIPKED